VGGLPVLQRGMSVSGNVLAIAYVYLPVTTPSDLVRTHCASRDSVLLLAGSFSVPSSPQPAKSESWLPCIGLGKKRFVCWL